MNVLIQLLRECVQEVQNFFDQYQVELITGVACIAIAAGLINLGLFLYNIGMLILQILGIFFTFQGIGVILGYIINVLILKQHLM
jgi:uncharacterized membrane protein